MSKIQVLYDGPIVKRADAKVSGDKRYFSGKSCPKGHVDERFTSNGRCVKCAYDQRDTFRKSNPEYERERYKRDRDRILEVNKSWSKKNPLNGRLKTMRYEARKNNAEGIHYEGDVDNLFTIQNGRCANCLQSIAEYYEIDHIMPLSLGGSNWPSNLQLLCMSCNRRKSAKHPIDWAKENGRLC